MRAGMRVLDSLASAASLFSSASAGQQQQRADVLFALRNYATNVKLAQKNSTTPTAIATAAAAVRVKIKLGCQLAQQTPDINNSIKRQHSSFAAHYSRYSASTIMTSYCKELQLKDYDIIGFDLDGTLLRYNLSEMTVLVYDVLKQFLVEQKGHSRALLELPLNLDFLQKGLVLDGPRGNILKLSSEAVILRATHGTRLLTDAEIVAAYGPERQWAVATDFYKDPLSTWNGPAAEQMRMLLDYFDMPCALVFAQAVDLVDQAAKQKPTEYNVWRDLQAGLMHIYSRENFANGKSAYFNAMRAEPERFVLRSSDQVIIWLQELRSAGKKLFLLTGSNIDFANLTATQAFGKDWPNMFDFVVTFAKKPGFFTMQRPFLDVDAVALRELPGSELSVDELLKPGDIYSQGNWHQLHAGLAKLLNKDVAQARAIYFGDNIIQDVYTPVKHRDFDAVAIAEELLIGDNGGNKNAIYPFSKALDSQFWGSYFSVCSTPTLWSGFIAKYAQLCVPSVELISHCPPSQRIVCENPSGFYPTQPKELECTSLPSCWKSDEV